MDRLQEMAVEDAAIRLLIASDVRLYSEGLHARLARTPGHEVLGAVPDLATLLDTLRHATVSIVLIDMSMPQSLEAVRALRRQHERVRVIGLSVPEDEDVLIPFIEAGLAGYLPRSGSVDELLRLIACVARGETFASPRIVASLFRRLSDAPVQRRACDALVLSPREIQIADLLATGLSNKQIVAQLGIRLPTVKKHVHSILAKLQVERRSQVAGRLRERRRQQREVLSGTTEPHAVLTGARALAGAPI